MDNSVKYLVKLSGFWVFIILTLAAFFKQFIFSSNYVDTQEYFEYGKWLFSNGFKEFSAQHFLINFRRTPLYPLITFCLNYNFKFIALFQCILSILIPFGLMRIWKNLALTSRSLNISLWILCTYPISFYLNASAMPDSFSQLGLLWFTIYILESKIWKAGFILALLIILKPIFIVIAFVWIVWVIIHRIPFSWALLIPFGVYLIWSSFNYINFHVFTFSSIGDENFYSYNRALILQKNLDQNSIDSIYNSENLQLDSFKSQSHKWEKIQQFMSSKNRETIFEYPISTCFLYLKGAVIMLVDPGRYDAMLFWDWPKRKGFLNIHDGNNSSSYPLYQWIYIGIFTLFNLIKVLLAIVGYWNWKRYSQINFLCIIIIVFCATCGPVGSARYSVTILPMLAILSTLGIEYFIKIKK